MKNTMVLNDKKKIYFNQRIIMKMYRGQPLYLMQVFISWTTLLQPGVRWRFRWAFILFTHASEW
jgi:hypothetical protein